MRGTTWGSLFFLGILLYSQGVGAQETVLFPPEAADCAGQRVVGEHLEYSVCHDTQMATWPSALPRGPWEWQDVQVGWTAVEGTGTVVWRVELLRHEFDVTMRDTFTESLALHRAQPEGMKRQERAYVRLWRDRDDPLDTFTGDAQVLGLRVTRQRPTWWEQVKALWDAWWQ